MINIFGSLLKGCKQPVVLSPTSSPRQPPKLFYAGPSSEQEGPSQEAEKPSAGAQDHTRTLNVIFDRLLKHADHKKSGIVQEEELQKLLPMLRAQGGAGVSFAFLLEWAGLGSFGLVEWVQHMRSLEYPEQTLQSFLAAVEKLDASPVQHLPQQQPARLQQPAPRALGRTSEATKDGQAEPILPPGFKMVGSDSEPGKLRYYDPVAHVKYTTLETAWQAYELRKQSLQPARSALLARVRRDFSNSLAAAEASRIAADAPGQRGRMAWGTSAPIDVPVPGMDSRFLDTDFPPARVSLGVPRPGRSFIDEARVASTKWIRLPSLIRMNSGLPESAPVPLWQRISPQDLTQGQIGNCWLIATIAALAEFPSAIQGLFISADVEIGRYVVRLYDMSKAEWEEVVVDDYIPCSYEPDWTGIPCTTDEAGNKIYKYEDTHNHDGTSRVPKKWIPHFARPTGNTMWAPLLEKAMAKFVGSYAWLAGGSEPYALTAFTGMPLVYCFVRPSADTEDTSAQLGSWDWCGAQYISRDKTGMNYAPVSAENPTLADDDMWQRLLQYDARNYVMTASITKFARPNTMRGFFREDGLVLGHAYSLISCQGVTLNPMPTKVFWVDDDGDDVGFECIAGRIYAICNGQKYQPNGDAYIVDLVVSEREGSFSARDSAGTSFGNPCPLDQCAELQRLWATTSAGIAENGQPLRLVMLRNPHGEGEANSEGFMSTEWSGTWCNGSGLWDALPEVAQQVNYEPTMRDGMFWMNWEDFRKTFDKVCILAKSMAEVRAASAFECRAERNREICMGVAHMVSKMADAGLVQDLRQVSVIFDPFCMLPNFLDDGNIETRLRWEASKPGRLQAYLDLNKASGNEAGYNYFAKMIRELGLQHALKNGGHLSEDAGSRPGHVLQDYKV